MAWMTTGACATGPTGEIAHRGPLPHQTATKADTQCWRCESCGAVGVEVVPGGGA